MPKCQKILLKTRSAAVSKLVAEQTQAEILQIQAIGNPPKANTVAAFLSLIFDVNVMIILTDAIPLMREAAEDNWNVSSMIFCRDFLHHLLNLKTYMLSVGLIQTTGKLLETTSFKDLRRGIHATELSTMFWSQEMDETLQKDLRTSIQEASKEQSL